MADSEDYAGADGTVATIGVFDGVHRGHQVLLGRARGQADVRGLPLVAVTFDPHPMAVVGARVAPPSLASVARRVELLQAHGADAVRVLAFDEAMSQLSPDEFIERLLVDELALRDLVIGEDFRFGRGASGTVATLRDAGEEFGFDVTAVPLIGDGTQRWSSTHARELIERGDVVAAASVLGRPYSLEGIIVHGDHRGRELGYPTANLSWPVGATVPADGVYAGWLVVAEQALPAAISVGTNPQFDGLDRRVESYVLDRDDLDLYGLPVEVQFVDRLRGQQAFVDVPTLVGQIGRDVDQARAILQAAK